jgi:hypothetical protein
MFIEYQGLVLETREAISKSRWSLALSRSMLSGNNFLMTHILLITRFFIVSLIINIMINILTRLSLHKSFGKFPTSEISGWSGLHIFKVCDTCWHQKLMGTQTFPSTFPSCVCLPPTFHIGFYHSFSTGLIKS